jgi:hypothetical protein
MQHTMQHACENASTQSRHHLKIFSAAALISFPNPLRWKSGPEKRVVLWSRIDQKSCLKAIVTAGFDLVVVPLRASGDELSTDSTALEALLDQHRDRVTRTFIQGGCARVASLPLYVKPLGTAAPLRVAIEPSRNPTRPPIRCWVMWSLNRPTT